MPKSRRSGSIGSGSSGGSNNGGALGSSGLSGLSGAGGRSIIDELANRLLERLSNVGPIDIPIESASRDRVENVRVSFDAESQNTATVHSESGGTYSVDYIDDTCTCLHHRIRGARCRHIEATHRALGHVSRRLQEDSVIPETNISEQDILSAVKDLTSLDERDEENRRELRYEFEDDELFYTDNIELFNQDFERAALEDLDYDYENALNGSPITFGLEIEFEDGDSNEIARELYDLGLCAYPSRADYHSSAQPRVPGKWSMEFDCSVAERYTPRGGELVSPVLKDTPETWKNLKIICEVAQRHGAKISQKCGGHVHIGMSPLDTARQRWKRFFRLVGGYENEIRRFAGGTLGRIRPGASRYAQQFSRLAQRGLNARNDMATPEDINSLASSLQPRSHSDRYYGINLTNIYQNDKPNTVEFRHFNSSLDHRQLQANVKMANGIVMAAEMARFKNDAANGITLSEAMKKRGKMLKDQRIGADERRDHSGIRKLLDIAFPRNKDKTNILRVLAKNTWENYTCQN